MATSQTGARAARHTVSGRWQLGLGLTLVTCFWWGILPITLAGVLPRLDPLTLTFYRFFFAVIVLLPILAFRGELGQFTVLKNSRVSRFIVFAGFMLAVNYGLYIVALERMSATGAQVLIQLAPMLFLLSGIYLFRESFSGRQWLGVVIFVLGLLVFFHQRIADMFSQIQVSGAGRYGEGMLLMVLAAICWACYAIAQKRVAAQLGSLHLMLIINGIGSAIFLPLSQPLLVVELNSLEWLLLILCGLNTVIAYGSFAEALNHWEASRISATLAIVPLLTMAFVYLVSLYPIVDIVYEPINSLILVGAVLVVLGAAMASLPRRG